MSKMRRPASIFVSAVVHLCLLGTTSTAVAVLSRGGISAAVVALISFAMVPIAYNQAVRNVGEYRATVQAVVNTNRLSLARALGFRLPASFADERDFWEQYVELIQHGRDDALLTWLDAHRLMDDEVLQTNTSLPAPGT